MQKALDELYNRRNQIAHQSDRSERDAKQNDISKTQVEKYIKNINKIVIAIIDEIKTL